MWARFREPAAVTNMASRPSAAPAFVLAAVVLATLWLLDVPTSVVAFATVVGGFFLLLAGAHLLDELGERATERRLARLARLAESGAREDTARGERIARRMTRGKAPLPRSPVFIHALDHAGPLRHHLLRLAFTRGSTVHHDYLDAFERCVEELGRDELELLGGWLRKVHVGAGHPLEGRYMALAERVAELLGPPPDAAARR